MGRRKMHKKRGEKAYVAPPPMKTLYEHIQEERNIRANKQQLALLEQLDKEVNFLSHKVNNNKIILVYSHIQYEAIVCLEIICFNDGYDVEDENVDTMNLEKLIIYIAKWYLDTEETYP